MLRLTALLFIYQTLFLTASANAEADDSQNYSVCKLIERHNGWTGSGRVCSEKRSDFGSLVRICLEAQVPDCQSLMLELTNCMNSLGQNLTCKRGAFVGNGHDGYVTFDDPAKYHVKGTHPSKPEAPTSHAPIVRQDTLPAASNNEMKRHNSSSDLPEFPFCHEAGGGWMEAIDYLKWKGLRRVHDVRFVSPPVRPDPIESVPEIGTILTFDDQNPGQLLSGAEPCVQLRCEAPTTTVTGNFRVARRLSYPSQEGMARTWQLCVFKEPK